MHIWQALIMGLVQGLTEFLPVSSSAHLVFADHFLHLHLSEAGTISFDVLLHLGTLVAVLIYFRKDVLALLRGAGQLVVSPKRAWRENTHSRLFALLMLATIPAGIAGVALKDFFSQAFQDVRGTALLLLVTAAMLIWITRRRSGDRSMESANWKDALIIGAFQAFAILPGVSRSGSTITGGLLRGLDRDAAPRFSFLLSIPIILAGGLFDLKDSLETGFAIPFPLMAVGFIAAAVSGYIAVVLLLGVVRRGRLDRFAYYCIAVGICMAAYWHWLVPKIDTKDLVARTALQTYAPNAESEVGPIELGEQVQFEVQVRPGVVPVQEVYALVPEPGHNAMAATATARFSRTAGNSAYLSEMYKLLPIGDHYEPSPTGDVRDIWVIVRNRWGIQNEVRVRVRVVPESLQRRTA